MDKQSLVLILRECFQIEGNYAVLFFNDGTSLMFKKKPVFRNLVMDIEVNEAYNGGIVTEMYFIPYNSVSYVSITNEDNLRIVYDYHHKRIKSD